MKTENAEQVGKHAFEVAGLGLAPFRFVGSSENVVTYPDGTSKAGGTCDYCGTGIRTECHVQSSDGKTFKVGCDCIAKVGEVGILKAYKTSPEYRAKQRAAQARKDGIVMKELQELIEANKPLLEGKPHPRGFTNRETGEPLTALDYANWMFDHCGASGRKGLLIGLKKMISV